MKNNPFKIWGSWVGALIGLISRPFGGWIILVFSGLCNGEFCDNSGVIAYIFLALLGFLIGWGIHSLIRKLKNKN